MNGCDHVYRSNFVPGHGYVVGAPIPFVADCPHCQWARPFHTFEAAVGQLGEHAKSAGGPEHDRLFRELLESSFPMFRQDVA